MNEEEGDGWVPPPVLLAPILPNRTPLWRSGWRWMSRRG